MEVLHTKHPNAHPFVVHISSGNRTPRLLLRYPPHCCPEFPAEHQAMVCLIPMLAIEIFFVAYFGAEFEIMLILKLYIYLPCINTQQLETAPFDDTSVISPIQSKHWRTGHYHIYSFLNILIYGELSIYVLLLRFVLSHRYNMQDNTGWLFLIVLHSVKRFVWYIFLFTQYSYCRDFFCLGPALCPS